MSTDDSANAKTPTEPLSDSFLEEFKKNQIKLTSIQKFILSTGSSLTALLDPHR